MKSLLSYVRFSIWRAPIFFWIPMAMVSPRFIVPWYHDSGYQTNHVYWVYSSSNSAKLTYQVDYVTRSLHALYRHVFLRQLWINSMEPLHRVQTRPNSARWCVCRWIEEPTFPSKNYSMPGIGVLMEGDTRHRGTKEENILIEDGLMKGDIRYSRQWIIKNLRNNA